MKNVVVTAELTVSDDDAERLVKDWQDGYMRAVVYDAFDTDDCSTYFFEVSHLRVEDAE
jgi:hypothetical protein